MTTEAPKVDPSMFTAFIPSTHADEVVVGPHPAEGDVMEMVCTYANPEHGYGLMFRVKGKEEEKPRIWTPY